VNAPISGTASARSGFQISRGKQVTGRVSDKGLRRGTSWDSGERGAQRFALADDILYGLLRVEMIQLYGALTTSTGSRSAALAAASPP